MCFRNIKKQKSIQSIGSVGGKPIERTNALTLDRDAQEYLEAAKDLKEIHKKEIIFKPVYFLTLRSIELGFKSLLKIKEGISTEELKNRYGHNIKKLMNRCIKEKYVQLNREEREAIQLINDYYLRKLIEYTEMGYKEIPLLHYYTSIAEKIIRTFSEISSNIGATRYI